MKQFVISEGTKAFIKAHKEDNIKFLALHHKCNDDVDIQFALQQIEGYQLSKTKLPSLCAFFNDIIFPVHLSLEQCSSEISAKYKAEISPKGLTMADLTGGYGIDFSFIAKNFEQAYYIEQNEDLCVIANQNFKTLGLTHAHILNTSAEEFLKNTQINFSLIFIDPARRDANGRKTFLPQDCTPDLSSFQDKILQKTNQLLIKYAPLLDIKLALQVLKQVFEIHIVSVENECKELLFKIDKSIQTEEPKLICVNEKRGRRETFEFTFTEENNAPLYANSIKKYLYEPNSSIMKAGAYNTISNKFQVDKLATNSHLYTSDSLISNFPGRIFEVSICSSFNKTEIKDTLKDITKANLSIRNYPSSVEDLKKKLKLKDGGDIYLFATTICSNQHILVGGKQLFY